MRYLIILCTTCQIQAIAQSWCPPGAQWYFNYVASQGQYTGYVHVVYEGDTLIEGGTAQILNGHWYYTWMPTMVNGDEHFGRWYTRSIGDRVDIWTGMEFDTLYRFDAVPGDLWQHPPSEIQLVVVDTATVIIDGLPLRRQAIQAYLDEGIGAEPWGPVHYITERLGGDLVFLWTSQLIYPDWAPAYIRCYSDDEISYTSTETACDILLSVSDERSVSYSVLAHPNPGTDHFTLPLPPGPHQLTLFDAQGRVILRQQVSEERPVIFTASLPSGIYHIHITDRYGRISGHRWVKE